jgi:hypothetical protein
MPEEKEEKPRSPLTKQLGKMIAKATFKIDQNGIPKLRQLYTQIMSDKEKEILKSWIDQVVPLVHSPLSHMMGTLHVDLRYPYGENEDIRINDLSALAIKNAIVHWDRGEEYSPGSFEEVCNV